MTGVARPPKSDSSRGPSPHDEKKDILAGPEGSGGFKIDGKAPPVRKLSKKDIHKPDRPVIIDKEPKPKLHPHLPRSRKYIDGTDRTILPSKVGVQLPPKPKVEAHSFKIKAALATLGGGASVGVAIGAAAGSAVPVVGTIVGGVVGFVVGGVVGHLVKKYGRSHSHHGYHQNAIKSLEGQGVKFTQREMDRLKKIRPDQWYHLIKDKGPVIRALRHYSKLAWGTKRWAKQYYYQFVVMAVAKRGFQRADISCFKILKTAKTELAAIRLGFKSESAFEEMQGSMSEWGADTFDTEKRSKTRAKIGMTDNKRAQAKYDWSQLINKVEKEFGEREAKYFAQRCKRYRDRGTEFDSFAKAVRVSKKMREALTAFLERHLEPYDDDIKLRISDLVKDYALDLAVRDVSSGSFQDAHNNFDQALIEKLVGTAARLQEVKDKDNPQPNKRVSRDVAVRRATLPNRISGYLDASNRSSDGLYRRFISGAEDIYDECEQLLEIPEKELVAGLKPIYRDPEVPAVPLATLQAKNLRHIAELAGWLKDANVDQGLARMILRLEAFERASNEGDPAKLRSVKDIKVKPGWSKALNENPEADLPGKDLLGLASYAAQQAQLLHAELAFGRGSNFKRLTERDAEDIYFDLVSVRWYAGNRDADSLRDSKSLKMLRENEFADVKKILEHGVNVGLAYETWLRGARTLDEAVECVRLKVDVKDVEKVAKMDPLELKKWRDKGFTDVEIAAYRGKLPDFKVRDGRQLVAGRRRIGIDDPRMAFFQGSNLTRDEAVRLLALNLAPNRANLPELKLRHQDATTYVLSDKPSGLGSNSEVYTEIIRNPDGTVDERVFKPTPVYLNDYERHEVMMRRVGSNLAASMVNEQLGFEAIVHTQISTRKGRVGISMERAKGYTASQLRSGRDCFVTVPKDVAHYDKLHEAVKKDLDEHGAISEETRDWAKEEFKFTRLRMVGDELQATGDFMADLLKDPSYREKLTDYQINLYLTDELDAHGSNYIIDVRLGPKGAYAAAVKGIDNDGGFAAWAYHPSSIRTMPRVISRRQADAIKDMYLERRDDGGITKKLNQVVVPSMIHMPVKPDVAFPFKHSREATAAALPTPENGNQVKQFEERLKLFYETIVQAETGNSPDRPDGHPPLTIITGSAPKKDKAPLKEDIEQDVSDNWGADNDIEKTWADKDVTEILENTASIFAREMMSRV